MFDTNVLSILPVLFLQYFSCFSLLCLRYLIGIIVHRKVYVNIARIGISEGKRNIMKYVIVKPIILFRFIRNI